MHLPIDFKKLNYYWTYWQTFKSKITSRFKKIIIHKLPTYFIATWSKVKQKLWHSFYWQKFLSIIKTLNYQRIL